MPNHCVSGLVARGHHAVAWLAALCALCALPLTAAGQTNLVQNGGFEDGLQSWSGVENTGSSYVSIPSLLSLETADVASGSGSLRLNAPPPRSEPPYYSHRAGALFTLSEGNLAGTTLRVQFSAKSLSGPAWLGISRVYGGGHENVQVTGSWQRYDTYLYVDYDGDAFVLSIVSGDSQLNQVLPTNGSMLIDDVHVSVVPNGYANMSRNSHFEGSNFSPWHGQKRQAGTELPAPEMLSIAYADTPNESYGALRFEVNRDPAYEYYSHVSGAILPLTHAAPANAVLRVRFFAKSVSGGTWLGVSRLWGGSFTYVPITTTWQAYDVTIPLAYDTQDIVFSIVGGDNDNLQPLVNGVVLLDDVDVRDARYVPPPRPSTGIMPAGVTHRPPSGEQSCSPDEMTWVSLYNPDGTLADVTWNQSSTSRPECQILVCDANNSPVTPQPSSPDNTLFGANGSTAGESCAAVQPLPKCGVDRSAPLGAICSSDSGCPTGHVCAEVCLDDVCSATEYRCAVPLAGCGGLPQESDCRDLDLCMAPEAYEKPETSIPGAERPEAPFVSQAVQQLQDVSSAPTQYLIGDVCEVARSGKSYGEDLRRGVMMGTDRWGIGFEAGLVYNMESASRGLSAATMDLYTAVDFGLQTTVMGEDVRALGVQGRVGAGTCGAAAAVGLTLFGKDIDLKGYSLGDAVDGLIGFEQFKNSQKDCRAAAEELDAYANRLKKAMLDAVEVHKQVLEAARQGQLPRITTALCRRTAEEFSRSWDFQMHDGRRVDYDKEDKDSRNGLCDAGETCGPSFVDEHLAGDVANCDTPSFWTADLGVAIARRWIDDYDHARRNYEAAYNYLLSKLPHVKGRLGLGWSSATAWDERNFNNDPWVTSGGSTRTGEAPTNTGGALAGSSLVVDGTPTYRVDGNVSRYSIYSITTSFPLGPISVLLAIEPSGYWGIGITLDWRVQNMVGANAVPSAMAAVNYVPRAGVDVMAYAGAGIGGSLASASLGIEGVLTLIEFRTPGAVGIGIVRPEQPDPRPIHPDLLPEQPTWYGRVQNRWDLQLILGAGMTADLLSGRINLAARVNVWRWKKTFRKKIASFPALATARWNWVGTLDIPVSNNVTADWTRPEVSYPQLPLADLPSLIAPLENGLNEQDTYTGSSLGFNTGCLDPLPPLI